MAAIVTRGLLSPRLRDLDAVAQAIRSEIRSLDRGLPPVTVETGPARVATKVAPMEVLRHD